MTEETMNISVTKQMALDLFEILLDWKPNRMQLQIPPQTQKSLWHIRTEVLSQFELGTQILAAENDARDSETTYRRTTARLEELKEKRHSFVPKLNEYRSNLI